MSKQWPTEKLGEVLTPANREEYVDASKEYCLLGIRLDGQGPFLRETVMGTQTSAAKLFRVAKGDFIYSRLFACRGAFGVVRHGRRDNARRGGEDYDLTRQILETLSQLPQKNGAKVVV
jgi:hypothetical protein